MSLSPYLNRFLQPDSIIPSPSNPQSWNRYSYVKNNPVLFNDPTGHNEACGVFGESCEYTPPPPTPANDYCATHQWACDGSTPDDNFDLSGNNGNQCSSGDPNCQLSITYPYTVSPYGAPCEKLFSSSACSTISKLIGVGVLIIDMTSLGLSVTGVIMELVGTATGPEGLVAAIALYAEYLNPIENTLGVISLGINAFNDFFVTGESFIDVTKKYNGTPSVDMVLGSDTSVSLVSTLIGAAPEGVIDSVVNVGVIGYDVYRLTGGQSLIQTHIILTANGNIHLRFGFPQNP